MTQKNGYKGEQNCVDYQISKVYHKNQSTKRRQIKTENSFYGICKAAKILETRKIYLEHSIQADYNIRRGMNAEYFAEDSSLVTKSSNPLVFCKLQRDVIHSKLITQACGSPSVMSRKRNSSQHNTLNYKHLNCNVTSDEFSTKLFSVYLPLYKRTPSITQKHAFYDTKGGLLEDKWACIRM